MAIATPNFDGEKRLRGYDKPMTMGVEASFQVGNFQDAPPGIATNRDTLRRLQSAKRGRWKAGIFPKRAFSPFWVVGGNPI